MAKYNISIGNAENVVIGNNMVNNFDDEIYHMCRRKEAYRTFQEAETTLRRVTTNGSHKPGTMHVYACPFCPGWHIGHVGSWQK